MTRLSKQGILNLPLATKPTSCKTCGMDFYSYVGKDASVHARYHDVFVNGPKCDLDADTNLHCNRLRVSLGRSSVECSVYCVDKKNFRLVRKIETLLETVNRALNAPPENAAWKEISESGSAGYAFAAVLNRRIVGLCVTEPITDIQKQTRWVVDRTQAVVPGQVNNRCKVGISRIWVAAKWRRHGIAQLLLETVQRALVYGMTLQKHEIAFSQPSHAGGKLARQFNGLCHKSGEILVPIYLE
ncbi:hypothetical protein METBISCDRAFT_15956 [Metschnikowia bicuspidata]|uniref:N-acetyltransferase ECO1 n=1 Tax=Metschnikowia bicuspidata TaxID=27322 RepID=A0A4P9ZCF8_9ASCO|nr:hypothetical protein METBISCDRAFT_15956 [Metschnikowia bicuspidata]